MLVNATAGDVGLDVEAVALPTVQISQLYHTGLRVQLFLQTTQEENIVCMLLFMCVDIVMSAVTHLAGALIFPIGDSIHQLVREDIPDVQLAVIFKQGSEWVSHIQGGLLFVFTYFQLEVRFAYISCEGGTGRSQGVYRQTRICLYSPNLKYFI